MAEDVHDRPQVPVRLPRETLSRLDRLIYYTGRGRSKQTLMEEAILLLMDKIEKEENRGQPFPEIPEGAKAVISKRRR